MHSDFSSKESLQVTFTPDAIELLNLLKVKGSLVIHVSDGCCDGTVPNCYLQDEFYSDSNDVVVYNEPPVKVLIPKATIDRFKNSLVIDVHDKNVAGFSLEVALDKRFYIRSE